MAETLKAAPGGSPPPAADKPESRFVNALDDPKALERIKIRLSVHGGAAGERFDLELVLGGDGRMTCDMACSLSERRVHNAVVRIDPARLAEIVRALDLPKLAVEALRQGGFPPCSLIGRIEADLDGETMSVFFMADPEQARTAGYYPPEAVMRAVDMLYAEAERHLGVKSIRP